MIFGATTIWMRYEIDPARHTMQPPNPTYDEDVEEEEEVRTLVVRAIDEEWVMGEDVVLPVTGDETIVEVQQARISG